MANPPKAGATPAIATGKTLPVPALQPAGLAATLAKVLPTLAVPTQGPMASPALWQVRANVQVARGAMATTYAALAALPQPWPWANGVQAVATALVPAQGAPRTWQQAQAAYKFAHGYMRGLIRNHSALHMAPQGAKPGAAKASKPAGKLVKANMPAKAPSSPATPPAATAGTTLPATPPAAPPSPATAS